MQTQADILAQRKRRYLNQTSPADAVLPYGPPDTLRPQAEPSHYLAQPDPGAVISSIPVSLSNTEIGSAAPTTPQPVPHRGFDAADAQALSNMGYNMPASAPAAPATAPPASIKRPAGRVASKGKGQAPAGPLPASIKSAATNEGDLLENATRPRTVTTPPQSLKASTPAMPAQAPLFESDPNPTPTAPYSSAMPVTAGMTPDRAAFYNQNPDMLTPSRRDAELMLPPAPRPEGHGFGHKLKDIGRGMLRGWILAGGNPLGAVVGGAFGAREGNMERYMYNAEDYPRYAAEKARLMKQGAEEEDMVARQQQMNAQRFNMQAGVQQMDLARQANARAQGNYEADQNRERQMLPLELKQRQLGISQAEQNLTQGKAADYDRVVDENGQVVYIKKGTDQSKATGIYTQDKMANIPPAVLRGYAVQRLLQKSGIQPGTQVPNPRFTATYNEALQMYGPSASNPDVQAMVAAEVAKRIPPKIAIEDSFSDNQIEAEVAGMHQEGMTRESTRSRRANQKGASKRPIFPKSKLQDFANLYHNGDINAAMQEIQQTHDIK